MSDKIKKYSPAQCVHCGSGRLLAQYSIGSPHPENICHACGRSDSKPAEPKAKHPLAKQDSTLHEPRLQGASLKMSTVQRNRYEGGNRKR